MLLVLAAGASTRLGEPKALATLGGRAALVGLLERALGPATGLVEAVVVTGAHHDAIAAALDGVEPPAGARIRVVENAAWERGRTGSFAVGVRAAAGRDLVLSPIDVPLVATSSYARLVERWEALGAPSRGWCAAALGSRDRTGVGGGDAEHGGDGCDGDDGGDGGDGGDTNGAPRFGHPVAIGRDLAARALDLGSDRPLRDLRGAADPLAHCLVDDPGVVEDLDTPDDLERLRRRAAAGLG